MMKRNWKGNRAGGGRLEAVFSAMTAVGLAENAARGETLFAGCLRVRAGRSVAPVFSPRIASQERQQTSPQGLRQALRLVAHAGANVEGFGFEDQQLLLVHDPVGEIQADALGNRGPEFDAEQVVVMRRGFVAEAALEHRKDRALVLQIQKWLAQTAEELVARRLQQTEVTGVIDVVAEGAVRIGYPVAVPEDALFHAGSLATGGGQCPTRCAGVVLGRRILILPPLGPVPRLVAQVSKPAVSPISKSAGRTSRHDPQGLKPAIQQTRRGA